MTRPIAAALALALLASPVVAQTSDAPPVEPPSAMERGMRLFMEGLRDEMEPALRNLEDLTRDAAPLLRELQGQLGAVVEDLDLYEAPEFLPNGDIIIRRRDPLPETVEPNPDGSIDL